ncbi:MAG TPA: dihydroorotate dehydrogenase-like protein [Bryobacteraceae bacterium]|nr:dihydroorotate dehydrogenase-like protein [Bryobacteraceae bacterium]
MMDLTTHYLGFELRSPLVVSASPLAKDLSNLRKMEDAGAGAVVLHSLFEEQISAEENSLDRLLSEGTESYAEALSYFPELPSYGMGPDAYLEHIRKAKQSIRIPVIGSLNGVSTGGWVRYARDIEQAGADALELNIYFLPTSVEIEGREIEASYCDLVEAVKSKVQIPVAVKLAPYFTSMANMASRLDRAGADALVLFNRFYQPDFDLELLNVIPHLTLSTSDELRLRLHWVAILSRTVRAELAITGGVHSPEDVLRGIMAGADVTMLTSALLKNGIGYLRELEAGVVDWMERHEYESIGQMRGSLNVAAVPEPGAFERANYIKVLGSYRA